MEDYNNPQMKEIRAFLESSEADRFILKRADEDDIPVMVSGCRVCDAILHAYGKPLQRSALIEVGKVEEVLSGNCSNHEDLMYGYFRDYEELGLEGEEVSIWKAPGDCFLQVFIGDNLYDPPFELVHESHKCETQSLRTSGVATNNSQVVKGFRHGKIIDTDWISLDTIRNWYQMCRTVHNLECEREILRRKLTGRPRFLIDVSENCIVSVKAGYMYTALSYVWGKISSCKLTKANLEALQRPGALREVEMADTIPITIRHAIDLTKLLGERYLWVDMLCIVQDESDDLKAEELSKMADIYCNAYLTIVVADGSHADYGLRGIQEVSQSLKRSCRQFCFSLGDYGKAACRMFSPKNDRSKENEGMLSPAYYRRAWTFQEYLFSRRKVIFEKGSVLWECCCTTWFEDVECSDAVELGQSAILSRDMSLFNRGIPDLYNLISMVNRFNQRELTFEEDVLAAFSGMASAMSLNFVGGFLSGLPELFFDVALLWQPDGELKRRSTTSREIIFPFAPGLAPPTWSWAGWTGSFDTWSWQSGMDFVKGCDGGPQTSRETIPITSWHSGKFSHSEGRRKISAQWYRFKEHFRNPDVKVPEGWTQHPSPGVPPGNTPWAYPDNSPPEGFGSCYFTHDSHRRRQFWYPIPLRDQDTDPIRLQPAQYLFARVEAATFYTRGIRLKSHTSSVTIENTAEEWAGVLRPHRSSDISEDVRARMQPLELVAISLGTARNSEPDEPGFEEWHLAERPKEGSLYEFYNVLWIFQCAGISFRRGIGRVPRDVWERGRPHEIDLILG